jgi:tetratricopeptide (TPR) repeat protein
MRYILIFTFIIFVLLIGCNQHGKIETSTSNDSFESDISKLIYQGSQFYFDKDFEMAEKSFVKAIEHKHASNYEYIESAYAFLGKIYNETESYDKTINVIESGLKLKFHTSELNKLIGIAYFKKEVIQESKMNFIEALNINPNTRECHYFLGLIYLLENKPYLALTEFEQELSICDNKAARNEIRKLKEGGITIKERK